MSGLTRPDFYGPVPRDEIDAAAKVMQNSYDAGCFALDPKDTAEAMLRAAYHARTVGMHFDGRMKDGAAVHVKMVDRGDLFPGFDENQNRFECFTTFIEFRFFDGRKDGAVLQNYVQADKIVADDCGCIPAYRLALDVQALDGMGLDIASFGEIWPHAMDWPHAMELIKDYGPNAPVVISKIRAMINA